MGNDDITPTSTEVRYLIRSMDKMDARLSDIFDVLREIKDVQSDEKAKLAAGIERCNGHHEAIKELRDFHDNPDRKGFVTSLIAILAAIGAFIVSIGRGGSSLFIISLVMAGCGSTTVRTNDLHQVKEVTKETPTADGGRLIEKTVTYQAQGQSVETTAPDPTAANFVGAVAPALGSAIGAATGTPGFPWAGTIEALGGAALTGWAAMKHAQANSLKDQVEFHKNDADEAKQKLDKTNG